MCYLALSPEQEVSSSSETSFAQGYKKISAYLAPKGRLGDRVEQAFKAGGKSTAATKLPLACSLTNANCNVM
ncbi:penicillin-binding protein activator [Vibrio lentus]|nr:penicillin-binding protein activator [Vibrio lentus]